MPHGTFLSDLHFIHEMQLSKVSKSFKLIKAKSIHTPIATCLHKKQFDEALVSYSMLPLYVSQRIQNVISFLYNLLEGFFKMQMVT